MTRSNNSLILTSNQPLNASTLSVRTFNPMDQGCECSIILEHSSDYYPDSIMSVVAEAHLCKNSPTYGLEGH